MELTLDINTVYPVEKVKVKVKVKVRWCWF